MSVNRSSEPNIESPDASNAQLRLFKVLCGLLAALLIGVAGLYVYKQHQSQPVEVVVDGKSVAVAANYASATAAIKFIKQSQSAGFGPANSPRIANQISFRRIPESASAQIDTDDTLRAKISGAVKVTVKAAVITVSNMPVVGLPDETLAKQTLDAVKQHYAQMPPNDPIDGEPTFRQAVTIQNRRISARLTRAKPEDAIHYLLNAPPPKTYIVRNGETGWKIAHKLHLKFQNFVIANAGRDINKLKIGDKVNISGGVPPISVIVVKRSETEEPIRRGASATNAGRRRVDTDTTYINGRATGSPQYLGVTTLERAAPSRSVM